MERHPLTGAPLLPGQGLVYGPAFTGPRITVVWLDRPETWPRWITMDAIGGSGAPVDEGKVAGGTWDGTPRYQTLPDVTVTEPRLVPWFLVGVLAFLALAMMDGRGGRRTW